MKSPHNLNEAMELAYKSTSDISDIGNGGFVVGRAVADKDGREFSEAYVSTDNLGEIEENIRQGLNEYIDAQMPTLSVEMTQSDYVLTFKMKNGAGQETYSTSIDLPCEDLLTMSDVADMWDRTKREIDELMRPPDEEEEEPQLSLGERIAMERDRILAEKNK